MAEYRTEEQYEEIIDSMFNGNWTQAAEQCVEYGFFANDLMTIHDKIAEEFGTEDDPSTVRDFVYLIAMATELRAKQGYYS